MGSTSPHSLHQLQGAQCIMNPSLMTPLETIDLVSNTNSAMLHNHSLLTHQHHLHQNHDLQHFQQHQQHQHQQHSSYPHQQIGLNDNHHHFIYHHAQQQYVQHQHHHQHQQHQHQHQHQHQLQQHHHHHSQFLNQAQDHHTASSIVDGQQHVSNQIEPQLHHQIDQQTNLHHHHQELIHDQQQQQANNIVATHHQQITDDQDSVHQDSHGHLHQLNQEQHSSEDSLVGIPSVLTNQQLLTNEHLGSTSPQSLHQLRGAPCMMSHSIMTPLETIDLVNNTNTAMLHNHSLLTHQHHHQNHDMQHYHQQQQYSSYPHQQIGLNDNHHHFIYHHAQQQYVQHHQQQQHHHHHSQFLSQNLDLQNSTSSIVEQQHPGQLEPQLHHQNDQNHHQHHHHDQHFSNLTTPHHQMNDDQESAHQDHHNHLHQLNQEQHHLDTHHQSIISAGISIDSGPTVVSGHNTLELPVSPLLTSPQDHESSPIVDLNNALTATTTSSTSSTTIEISNNLDASDNFHDVKNINTTLNDSGTNHYTSSQKRKSADLGNEFLPPTKTSNNINNTKATSNHKNTASIGAGLTANRDSNTTSKLGVGGRRRGRRRQHAVADQTNGLERVFIWDLDGTLIVYQYLLSSYYASVHSLDTRSVEKLQTLGARVQEMLCNFCDERLFYQDLKISGVDYMHIDDQNCEEAKSIDLSKYDFTGDGFTENKQNGSIMKYAPSANSQSLVSSSTETTHNNNESDMVGQVKSLQMHNQHHYSSYQQQNPALDAMIDAPDGQLQTENNYIFTGENNSNLDLASKSHNTTVEANSYNSNPNNNLQVIYSDKTKSNSALTRDQQKYQHFNHQYNHQHHPPLTNNNFIHHINTNHHSSYTHQCKSANIDWSRKLSFRYQRIKEIYEQYRTSVQNQDIIRYRGEWTSVVNSIDSLTDQWRLRAMDCLRLIADSPNCTNVVVTKSPLVFALGQLLCYGLGEYFPVDQIYSSHKVPKEACIRRIIKRFGPPNRCSYIVIGSDQEVELAKKVDLPFWRITCNDGHQQLSQLYRALKDGFLL